MTIFYYYGFWSVYFVLAFIMDTELENGLIRSIKVGITIEIQIKTIILILDIFKTIFVFLLGVVLGYYEGTRRK